MTFALTAAEIDEIAARAEGPVANYIAPLFWREAERPDISDERREALRLVALTLGLARHPTSSNSAQPLGKPAHGESPEQLTPEQAKDFAILAPAIQMPEIRATFADVAWLRIRGNPDGARLAVAAYLASARNLEDPEQWSEGIARAERAVRLGRSLGADDPAFRSAGEYLLEVVRKYRGEDPLFLTGEAVALLLEFEIGDPATYVEPLRRAADGAIARKNFHLARHYLELLAKLHRGRGDADAMNAALREVAQTFETEARLRESAGDYAIAVHNFNQAVQAYRRVPKSAAEIEALRLELKRVEPASLAQLKRIAGPTINISEFARVAREHVAGKELREAILRLAHVAPLANVEEMRKTAVYTIKQFPLSHLSTTTVVDSEGRTVGVARGGDIGEPREDAIFAEVVSHMIHQRRFAVQARIVPALNQLLLEHAVTQRDLMGLCAYSPFFPPQHERIFAEGLHAGFHSDFMTAIHLLVPQIENSFRHLMTDKNMVTTKLDQYGVQRQIDLSDLVIDSRLETILSKNVLLELRTLLTDNRGPNLRHALAHGMLGDDECFSAEALYAWWLVLVLCIYSPVVRAEAPAEPAAARAG
jgi:hypothetical protein